MRHKHFGKGLVTIKVGTGEESEEFQNHNNHICDSSNFFNAAFTSRFKEAAKQYLELPEERKDIFSFFCDWSYSGHVRPSKEYNYGDYPEDLFLFRVYLMADRLTIASIQEVIPLLPSAKKLFYPDCCTFLQPS
jgi:BTB/POZ domain